MLETYLSDTHDLSSDHEHERFKHWLVTTIFPRLWEESGEDHRFLALPPDRTRQASLSGEILLWFVAWVYEHYKNASVTLDILVTLGTHRPMDAGECRDMFGELVAYPEVRFLHHDYLHGVRLCGTSILPLLAELSEGTLTSDVRIELSEHLFSTYSCIFSLGQVLPHEIFGMSNYTKNVMIGLGGKDVIDKTHYLSALIGMEKIIGQRVNPLRTFIDDAYKRFVAPSKNIAFLHTVIGERRGVGEVGDEKAVSSHEKPYYLAGASFGWADAGGSAEDAFIWASACAQKHCIHEIVRTKKYIFAEFPEAGYTSVWITNKAIYRLRLVAAPGSTIVIMAPGLRALGESTHVASLIEHYGYMPKEKVIKLIKAEMMAETKKNSVQHSLKHSLEARLSESLAIAGHLIYGMPPDGVFVVYAVDGEKIDFSKLRAAGYGVMPYQEARSLRRKTLMEAPDDTISVINPSLGLWRVK